MRQWAMVIGSIRMLRCRVLGLGLSLVLAGTVYAHAADNLILVGDGSSMLGIEIGARLQQSLASAHQFDIKMTDGDQEVFRQVLAEPGNVGVGHADGFLEFIKGYPDKAGKLEFHGAIPACLLLVVARASSMQTFGDLIDRLRSEKPAKAIIDVGPVYAGAAATFSGLRRLVPEFKNAEITHSGGFRALSRVATGQIDATAMMVYTPFNNPQIDDLIRSDKIKLIPLYSHDLGTVFNDTKSPYRVREIKIGGGPWYAAKESVLTTCTSLGVVANTMVDGKLSEALARITLSGNLQNPKSTIEEKLKDGIKTARKGLELTQEWVEGAVSMVLGKSFDEARDNATPDGLAIAKPSSFPDSDPLAKEFLGSPSMNKLPLE